MEKPSYLTSTTSMAFLMTVSGFLGYCFWTKNTEGMMKILEMIVPAYMMSKGITMGQNGKPPEVKP